MPNALLKDDSTEYNFVPDYSRSNEIQNLVDDYSQLLVRTIESSEYQPPILPEIAVTLTRLVNQPDVSIDTVEKTVSEDPTIAARVVSVANSVFYCRGTPAKTLRTAVMRLGVQEVRDVAFQVVAKTTIFRVPGFQAPMRELLEAAQVSGLLAKKVCETLKFGTETAYLSGLLHDMGKAVILGILGSAIRDAPPGSAEFLALEQTIEQRHAPIGAWVCEKWGLSPDMCETIKYHHRPEASTESWQPAFAVKVSDVLLGHIGIGAPQKRIDPISDPLFKQLNVAPKDVENLIEFAETVLENRSELNPGRKRG
jgi:HD-like signal output (HDOD) protein